MNRRSVLVVYTEIYLIYQSTRVSYTLLM